MFQSLSTGPPLLGTARESGGSIRVRLAKARLDGARGSKEEATRLRNAPTRVRPRGRILPRYAVDRLVLEAAGQHERRLQKAPAGAAFAVLRLDRVRVRRFAEGRGGLAKHDSRPRSPESFSRSLHRSSGISRSGTPCHHEEARQHGFLAGGYVPASIARMPCAKQSRRITISTIWNHAIRQN